MLREIWYIKLCRQVFIYLPALSVTIVAILLQINVKLVLMGIKFGMTSCVSAYKIADELNLFIFKSAIT